MVAFRDTSGRVGLLEEFCAHRCASLFLGRNVQNGLRCVYHGWKYAVEGNCVDMPWDSFVDRSREHLGTTDRAVLTLRQGLLDAVKHVAENVEQSGVDPLPNRQVRPMAATTHRGAAWQEGLTGELVTRR